MLMAKHLAYAQVESAVFFVPRRLDLLIFSHCLLEPVLHVAALHLACSLERQENEDVIVGKDVTEALT